MPWLRCLRSRATFNWCPLFPFIQRARAGWEQKLPYSYRGRPSLILVSFLADKDETIKISWRQQSCLVKKPSRSWVSWAQTKSARFFTNYENHQGGLLRDSEDETFTKIFSVPVSETGQQSTQISSSKAMGDPTGESWKSSCREYF